MSMDTQELITTLRSTQSRSKRVLLDEAADTIEQLARERDAATEDIAEMLWLDGNCDYCLYAEKENYKGATRTKCGLAGQCQPAWRGMKEAE